MAARTAAQLVTEREFLALPESLDKIELIDGEVFVSPSLTPRHQVLVQRVLFELMQWAKTHSGPVFVGQSPLDVRLGSNRIVQPDVFVVFKDLSKLEQGPIDEVPALCVEVLSSNRSHDRITKRFLYGKAGVREFWVVDPAGRFERFFDEALETREELTGTLETPLPAGFTLDVAQLLA